MNKNYRTKFFLIVVLLICFYLTKLDAQEASATEPTNKPIDLLTLTNLEQCKVAIKGLKKLGGFIDKYGQHWLVEQHGRTNGLPVILNENGKTVQYAAVLISVDCLNRNDLDHASEIETQTQIMNIDETRKLGLQLCSTLGIDPKDFLAWCDKVGNQWLDTPLFGAGIRDAKNNRDIAFQTLHGFNPEKPWFINVIVEDH
jgi:hypothetical protein